MKELILAKAISIYLQDATLARLDREVERQAALDRLAGKAGRAVASRSSVIQDLVEQGLSTPGIFTLQELRALIEPVARQFGAARVSLFGSYAKGCATAGSDVDVLLEKGDIQGMRVLDFQDELAKTLGRSVDVVTTEAASPRFLAAIEQDAVVVFDRCAG